MPRIKMRTFIIGVLFTIELNGNYIQLEEKTSLLIITILGFTMGIGIMTALYQDYLSIRKK